MCLLGVACPTCTEDLECTWNTTCHVSENCMVRSISVTGFNFTTHCIMVIFETIKYGSASSNLSYSPKGFFNLIIPTVFDQLILLKEEFLIAQLFVYVYLVLTMFYGFEYREKTVIFCKCWQKQHMEKFSAVLMKTVYEK